MIQTQEIDRKAFGIYVGMLNSIKGYNLTVKEALQNETVITMFKLFSELSQLKEFEVKIEAHKTKSTRRDSYDKLNVPEVDATVLTCIKDHHGVTRKEISDFTGFQLSTVCGAVSRLINSRMAYVGGKKLDLSTNRNVETVKAST